MWQNVAHFFQATFDEILPLERQRKLTVVVLVAIMVIAAILIAFIIWADVFYS